nr:YutD family protein [Paenibacillus borealis]
MIVIGGKGYELMLDHKDGWNPEAFRGRYSEVLDRYDYIIGDWGYSQLRLKGFYRDNHPKVNRDTAISGMVDYINEYCNFGCAYFVLHKLKEAPQEGTFKDILIKEVPEPGTEEELEQEAAEPAVNVKDHRESPSKGGNQAASNRDKDHAGGSSREHAAKDRPVREHQSRNHRNKDGQGKKNHKEFQGRGQQGNQGNQGSNQGNPNNHKQNKENREHRENNPNRQNNQNKQDNPNSQNQNNSQA